MSISTRISSWRQYPIVLAGFDIRRWESVFGMDGYHPELAKKFIVFKSYPSQGPTHLQYHSPFGFLLTWPLCLHVWFQFRPQQIDANGYRVPGSERVFYWRFGARWEAETGFYVMPSWYGPGLRWD